MVGLPIWEVIVIKMLKKFNNWLGDHLAYGLSTMACFYIVFAICVLPLLIERPQTVIGWVQYIIQSIFQGASLPVLGYVARSVGDKQERVIHQRHDMLIEELNKLRDDLDAAREENRQLHGLLKEIHQSVKH